MNFKAIVAGVATLTCCLGGPVKAADWHGHWDNTIFPVAEELHQANTSGADDNTFCDLNDELSELLWGVRRVAIGNCTLV